jgi:hypothetical protein
MPVISPPSLPKGVDKMPSAIDKAGGQEKAARDLSRDKLKSMTGLGSSGEETEKEKKPDQPVQKMGKGIEKVGRETKEIGGRLGQIGGTALGAVAGSVIPGAGTAAGAKIGGEIGQKLGQAPGQMAELAGKGMQAMGKVQDITKKLGEGVDLGKLQEMATLDSERMQKVAKEVIDTTRRAAVAGAKIGAAVAAQQYWKAALEAVKNWKVILKMILYLVIFGFLFYLLVTSLPLIIFFIIRAKLSGQF